MTDTTFCHSLSSKDRHNETVGGSYRGYRTGLHTSLSCKGHVPLVRFVLLALHPNVSVHSMLSLTESLLFFVPISDAFGKRQSQSTLSIIKLYQRLLPRQLLPTKMPFSFFCWHFAYLKVPFQFIPDFFRSHLVPPLLSVQLHLLLKVQM